MVESKSAGKSFEIDKVLFVEAWEKVRANGGAAGVDGVTIEMFEENLKDNLYKIWNRMSSGTYFPPPVRSVEIPKADGQGVRTLGIPTVADRIAQTVVAMTVEPAAEEVFHPDSYGYRPGRSALDAVETCRVRCWKMDWVVDLDIKAFFDTVPHDRVYQAIAAHTDQKWVLLAVRRWLVAPLQQPDGTLVARDRGTPRGSAISPLLSNLFMHYAFDRWLSRKFPRVRFERYCDDAVVHCWSETQAREVWAAIAERLSEFGLSLHPDKTRIVYCKDSNRRGTYVHTECTFLGYTFRPRQARNKHGVNFTNFLPAVSKSAKKAMSRTMRSWHLGNRSDLELSNLVRWINPVVSGWINYYGRFYRSELVQFLQRTVNRMLVSWFRRKYKRLHRSWKKSREILLDVACAYPQLLAHWRFGARPAGWATRAV